MGKRQRKQGNGAEELDFDILPDLTGYHLRRAQVAVFASFTQAMGKVKLTPGQFGILVLIDANAGLSQSALARAIGIERSTMVAAIDALQARGLVERHRSDQDRRTNALKLSRKGQATLRKARTLVQDHEQMVFGDLGADGRAVLRETLRRIWSAPPGDGGA